MNRDAEVMVIGGGIAGLSAAIAAREAGARVHLIECAPRHHRGGNARHARNLRIAHDAPTPRTGQDESARVSIGSIGADRGRTDSRT